MKLYARKLSYLPKAIIPIGAFCIIIWKISSSKDPETLLIGALVLSTLATLFGYAILKQLKTPIIEINDEMIMVNDVMRGPAKMHWYMATELKRNWFLGYKLEGLGESIWLPVNLLKPEDRENVLAIVKSHISEKYGTDGGESR